jgi:hypothetical protein
MTWVDPMPGSVSHRRIASLLSSPLVLGLLTLAVSACTDTVCKDRPPSIRHLMPTVASSATSTTAERQTTCGNCHGPASRLDQTRHATAWSNPAGRSAADVSCQGCHTVNSRGNQATAAVGYDAVKDPAYQDVQCELSRGRVRSRSESDDCGNPSHSEHHGLSP